MTVGRNYLLEKPSGPSEPKRLFDQWVIPLIVNFASRCEFALDDASRRTGLRPSIVLSTGIAALVTLIWAVVRGRTPTRKLEDLHKRLL